MKPGIYPDLPMADYLALPAFSSGLAHTILTSSPLHAWHESALNPKREREESADLDLGTYAHAMLLDGGTDRLVVCDFLDWRSMAAREIRDTARFNGELPILAIKLPEVEAMVKAAVEFIASSEIAGIFGSGAAEQTLIWEEEDGVLCKARPDWLTDGGAILMHYKTTGASALPEAFSRGPLVSMGYDVALAFYERALYAIPDHGTEAPTSVILAQENFAPYSCSLVSLDPALADIAGRKVNRAIALWGKCMSANHWPAYPTHIHYAEPRPWQITAEEQELYGDRFTDSELVGGIPA